MQCLLIFQLHVVDYEYALLDGLAHQYAVKPHWSLLMTRGDYIDMLFKIGNYCHSQT